MRPATAYTRTPTNYSASREVCLEPPPRPLPAPTHSMPPSQQPPECTPRAQQSGGTRRHSPTAAASGGAGSRRTQRSRRLVFRSRRMLSNTCQERRRGRAQTMRSAPHKTFGPSNLVTSCYVGSADPARYAAAAAAQPRSCSGRLLLQTGPGTQHRPEQYPRPARFVELAVLQA